MNKDKEFQTKFCIDNLFELYTNQYPCLYWNNFYKGTDLMRKDDTLKSIFDNNIKEDFDSFTLNNPEKKLLFIDILSAYGNCVLSTFYGLSCQEIFELGDTEEKAKILGTKTKRLWEKSEIWGVDISENALKYGESQNIFDKILCLDINKIFLKEHEKVLRSTQELITNCNLITLCSTPYINDDVLFKFFEWFSSGTSEGYLIISLTYPIDITDRFKKIKKYLLIHCEFVDSMPGKHRDFLNEKEKSQYKEIMSFNETWCFKRKFPENIS